MKPLLPHVHKTHGHISKLVVTVVQYGLGRKYQIRNSFYFCHHSDFLSTVRVAIELCVLKENAISVRTLGNLLTHMFTSSWVGPMYSCKKCCLGNFTFAY